MTLTCSSSSFILRRLATSCSRIACRTDGLTLPPPSASKMPSNDDDNATLFADASASIFDLPVRPSYIRDSFTSIRLTGLEPSVTDGASLDDDNAGETEANPSKMFAGDEAAVSVAVVDVEWRSNPDRVVVVVVCWFCFTQQTMRVGLVAVAVPQSDGSMSSSVCVDRTPSPSETNTLFSVSLANSCMIGGERSEEAEEGWGEDSEEGFAERLKRFRVFRFSALFSESR